MLSGLTTPTAAREAIAQRVSRREQTFLSTLERGVFAYPESPYRKLLLHAGFDFAAVSQLVNELGLDAALGRLYDAGVYVTAEEFKGRRPIRRGDFELQAKATDFDNPLADAQFEGESSGSTGNPTRVFIGFELMEVDSAHFVCLFDAPGISGQPLAFWHGALHTALKNLFRHFKRGRAPDRWFTPMPSTRTLRSLKEQYLVAVTFCVSLLHGKLLPRPQYVRRGEAHVVAAWLAEQTRKGRPAVLETNQSQAVRVCLAAKKLSLDISGSVFHMTGEPYTRAKAAIVESAGARGLDRYSNVELGTMGIACSEPVSFDDQHFVSDKLALVLRQKSLPGSTAPVEAMVLTSISPATSKLALNVESGDYATVTTRQCGCPFGAAGLLTHLCDIRAYDKLTSDGVTFQAQDIFQLLEEVLPNKYGGGPTDYQLVEIESDGLPQVQLRVRPSIGDVDEIELAETVYRALRRHSYGMATEWLEGSVLQIVRRDPIETGSAKILPLHVVHNVNEGAAAG